MAPNGTDTPNRALRPADRTTEAKVGTSALRPATDRTEILMKRWTCLRPGSWVGDGGRWAAVRERHGWTLIDHVSGVATRWQSLLECQLTAAGVAASEPDPVELEYVRLIEAARSPDEAQELSMALEFYLEHIA